MMIFDDGRLVIVADHERGVSMVDVEPEREFRWTARCFPMVDHTPRFPWSYGPHFDGRGRRDGSDSQVRRIRMPAAPLVLEMVVKSSMVVDLV